MQPFESIVTVTLNPAIDRVMRIDGFRVGGHQKGETLARVPAGKGVNVSRVLSRLGVPSIAMGLIGIGQAEEYGTSLRGSLVSAEFLTVDGRTRENVTVVDRQSGTETHLRDTGISVTPSDVNRVRNTINLLAKPDRLVVFSGSLPPGMEVGDAVALIDIVLSSGAHVAVDGSPELLRDIDDRSVWLVKPNAAELLEMAGEEHREGDEPQATSHDEVDKALIRRIVQDRLPNADIVLVSRGASGAFLFAEDDAYDGHVSFDARRVESTVGCGDSMLAAFVASWQRTSDLEGCLRDALAAATAASTEIAPGRVDPDVIAELMPCVSISRMS